MVVKATKAIEFECEKCGKSQFAEYTLELSWEEDRNVMADNIECKFCDHDNHVVEEL